MIYRSQKKGCLSLLLSLVFALSVFFGLESQQIRVQAAWFPVSEVSAYLDWEGDAGHEAERPAKVIAHVLQNGVSPFPSQDGEELKDYILDIEHVEFEGESFWAGELEEGLTAYVNNDEIYDYSLRLEEVPNYRYEIERFDARPDDDEYFKQFSFAFHIRMIYDPRVDVGVSVNWQDFENVDGKRPESLSLKLLANGAPTDKTLDCTAPDWSGRFENLPQFDAEGTAIAYAIETPTIPDYEVNVTGDAEAGFIIDASYKPVLDVPVSVKWDDFENIDKKRPEAVSVKLVADGVPTDTTLDLSDPNWADTFKSLPKYKLSESEDPVAVEIKYTIETPEIPGYEVRVTGDSTTGYVFEASYNPELKFNVKIDWDDAENKAAKRPASVPVKILADAVLTDKVVTLDTADPAWSKVVTGLPKFTTVNGKAHEIMYSLEAPAIAGYSVGKVKGDVTTGFVIPASFVEEVLETTTTVKTDPSTTLTEKADPTVTSTNSSLADPTDPVAKGRLPMTGELAGSAMLVVPALVIALAGIKRHTCHKED